MCASLVLGVWRMLTSPGGGGRYVAMHTMQEDEAGGQHGVGEAVGNGYGDGGVGGRDGRQKEGRSLRLVLAAVAGMLLPLVTQVGGHAH